MPHPTTHISPGTKSMSMSMRYEGVRLRIRRSHRTPPGNDTSHTTATPEWPKASRIESRSRPRASPQPLGHVGPDTRGGRTKSVGHLCRSIKSQASDYTIGFALYVGEMPVRRTTLSNHQSSVVRWKSHLFQMMQMRVERDASRRAIQEADHCLEFTGVFQDWHKRERSRLRQPNAVAQGLNAQPQAPV